MILLVFFAFLAGIVTILSPCILPILPIVLSGGIGVDKRRPLGIVIGFILSFTFFTLFLSTIVKATGISADALRVASVVILFGFGVSLLVPQFQVLLERLFSKLAGGVKTQNTNAGFFSGVLVGLSLGLIWTPCVGPILASVITLAATSDVSLAAFFITFAYSLGTAIPMFAIMYGGRSLFQKVPWLLPNSGKIQKAFGVLMIVTAIGIFFNLDRKFQTYILTVFPQYGVGLTKFEENAAVKQQLDKLKNSDSKQEPVNLFGDKQYPDAPELISGGQWFTPPSPMATEGQVLKSLRGKVVLVDFWTYTCINCIRTLPYLKDWHEKYADKGLVIIGVHTPEFEFEKNPDNVKKAIADFGIKYSVVQDNDYATWKAYDNHYWPAKYFVDKNGKIRSTHFGEGEYAESEKMIQDLLKETGASVDKTQINTTTYTIDAQTPELYLGYARIEHLVSPEKIQQDMDAQYSIPASLPSKSFGYGGKWNIGAEKAMPNKNALLKLRFSSKEVFLVMRSKDGKEGMVKVSLDGKVVAENAGSDVIQGTVNVRDNKLYKLIKLPQAGEHTLELEFLDPNLEIYAFTFG